ncbi:MAG: YciI family protein [Paludibacteraceae bacterium]|nr:YciI family protein [Paludibacteraceae bacterium]
MFLILLNYTNGLDAINKHLDAHRAYLDKYYALNKFICSGAQNPRTGGVIICQAESREEVQGIINEDPFRINHAAEYDIIEFSPTKYAQAFEPVVSKN